MKWNYYGLDMDVPGRPIGLIVSDCIIETHHTVVYKNVLWITSHPFVLYASLLFLKPLRPLLKCLTDHLSGFDGEKSSIR